MVCLRSEGLLPQSIGPTSSAAWLLAHQRRFQERRCTMRIKGASAPSRGNRCALLYLKGSLTLLSVCLSMIMIWNQYYGASSLVHDFLHLNEDAIQLHDTKIQAANVVVTEEENYDDLEPKNLPDESRQVMSMGQPVVKINLAGKPKVYKMESISQAATNMSDQYQRTLNRSTMLNPELMTVAFQPIFFFSGFCNELMAFSSFVMDVFDMNISQILMPSLNWKDLTDVEKKVYIPHEKIWDVVHWNKYAESKPLPRLVAHHHTLVNFDPVTRRWRQQGNATNPVPYGKQVQLFVKYKRYTRRFENDGKHLSRHPTDAAIWEGAMKPHPDLLAIIQDTKNTILSSTFQGYLCLHARVEPEMQFHDQCKEDKVIALKDIVDQIYKHFPIPPVSKVLIVLNRQNLEAEDRSKNRLAGENLDLLNHLRAHGMWNRSVEVVEAGTEILPKDSYYGRYCSHLCGSIVNYYLAIEAKIFVGTSISTFSSSVVAARSGRNHTQNYLYTPNGIRSTGNFKFHC